MRERAGTALFVLSVALLAAGAAAWLADADTWASGAWIGGTALGLAASTWWTVEAARRREPTVDVIAVLALAGALVVGEPFAGAMVTVMLTSGRLLEARAQARARRELSLLVERAPRTARRRTAAGVEEVPVDEVSRGDRVVVAGGEVVPVDGRITGAAVVDESALTGEPLPVERAAGEEVRSGVVNAGPPIELVATSIAADSTYAGLVRLVEQAKASSAPFVRTADRYALVFVPVTLVLAGAAWVWAGDPVRAVAVLVVATPCPLILAAPIAVMSGLSRAAGRGVVVKGGGALERLAAGTVLLFDKTGTLTRGRPSVAGVVTAPGGPETDEVLRVAASLDQLSPHVLADAVVRAARERGLGLSDPGEVLEEHGAGVTGTVDGTRVRLGKTGWVLGGPPPGWLEQVLRRADLDGSMVVLVEIDGAPVGALLLDDPVRADAPRMVRALRAAGIDRVVLVTGDHEHIAAAVGRVVGVDAVRADRDPAGKVEIIREESDRAATIMVGDGVNDAPALAAAGVGVALAARGATASSEAADVVLTVDRVDALADAVLIARRSGRVALESVVVGMGLSLVAMVAAAGGLLPPAAGAVLQEGIDVLAIGIALRALLPSRLHAPSLSEDDAQVARQLRVEHDAVLTDVEQIRAVADELTDDRADLGPVRELVERLETTLLPHERAEEELLVPLVGRALGGHDVTAALSRTHAEIEHQVALLHRVVDGAPDPPELADVVELRRLLYGLYAVLRLHNAQEEEGAFTLVPDKPQPPSGT